MKISVLITCYNRRSITIACLEALFENTLPDECTLDVFLVDDGSTDNTAEAVQAAFPLVNVIRGDSNLFWCRGMHKAFSAAYLHQFDYYVWLNDDTILHRDALLRLLQCHAELEDRRPAIIAGSTIDPINGNLSYGGFLRLSRFKPTTFDRVSPSSKPVLCDAMSGNIVLIPSQVANALGNLDPVFQHAMGDIDYGLRARRMGFDIWLAPGIFGACSNNSDAATYIDSSQSLQQRWKQMMSRKGLPWHSWLVLTRRHAGPLWFLYFAWPYIRLILGGYRSR